MRIESFQLAAFAGEVDAADDVVVSTDIVATGFFVELIRTEVALYNILRGALFDVHTLVAVGPDNVALDQVVDAVVGRFVIDPLYSRNNKNINIVRSAKQLSK